MRKRAIPETELPKWAIVQIRKLSKQSGVSFEKLRDMSLRFGLYQTREELQPIINLLESSEALGRIDEEPENVDTPIDDEYQTQAEADLEHAGDVGSGNVGLNGSATQPDNAGERRDEPFESVSADDFVASLSGD